MQILLEPNFHFDTFKVLSLYFYFGTKLKFKLYLQINIKFLYIPLSCRQKNFASCNVDAKTMSTEKYYKSYHLQAVFSWFLIKHGFFCFNYII